MGLERIRTAVVGFVAEKPAWCRLALGIGRKVIKPLYPNYLVGLSIGAQQLAQAIKGRGIKDILSSYYGSFRFLGADIMVDFSEYRGSATPIRLADNFLAEYLAEAKVDLKITSASELTRLGRAVRAAAKRDSVFNGEVLAAMISKSHSVEEFNSWAVNLGAIATSSPQVTGRAAESAQLLAAINRVNSPDELAPDPCQLLSACYFSEVLRGLIAPTGTS